MFALCRERPDALRRCGNQWLNFVGFIVPTNGAGAGTLLPQDDEELLRYVFLFVQLIYVTVLIG
jgi:hypothetical protein